MFEKIIWTHDGEISELAVTAPRRTARGSEVDDAVPESLSCLLSEKRSQNSKTTGTRHGPLQMPRERCALFPQYPNESVVLYYCNETGQNPATFLGEASVVEIKTYFEWVVDRHAKIRAG